MVALTDTDSVDDLLAWRDEFGSMHHVLGDYDRDVWSAYTLSSGRPQYVVIDQNQTVVFASRFAHEAEAEVEALLGL